MLTDDTNQRLAQVSEDLKRSCNQFGRLRESQQTREREWDKDAPTDLSFRGNELAGETGEALDAVVQRLFATLEISLDLIQLGAASGRVSNLLKKLERTRMGMVGAPATVEEVGDELSDVVICVDRIASKLGIQMWPAIVGKFNKTSEKYGLETKL